ncbi:hypothetical protein PTKIN_Ptkin14bG0008500 [Pterospermum kingtungense]
MKGLETEVVKIFTKLSCIDLSNNKFEGEIPKQHFNVSDNQLQGRIPQGKQFGTLIGNDSYEGNFGLCGFPVSIGCSNIESPPSNWLAQDGSKSNFAFGWKVVLIGHACGVVFGLAMGYVAFRTIVGVEEEGSNQCKWCSSSSVTFSKFL